MKKIIQKVIRTYPGGYNITTKYLEAELANGYIVKHVTPINDGILEYIVEKEI